MARQNFVVLACVGEHLWSQGFETEEGVEAAEVFLADVPGCRHVVIEEGRGEREERPERPDRGRPGKPGRP